MAVGAIEVSAGHQCRARTAALDEPPCRSRHGCQVGHRLARECLGLGQVGRNDRGERHQLATEDATAARSSRARPVEARMTGSST